MERDNISQHVSIIAVSTVICYTRANMYKLPLSILQKLKCANCDGYLRSAPIMLNNANHQLCGKCFKLIPQQEMINYRHELGLEAVAELFAFPCRYHLHGCNITFHFNEENEHELKCSFRFSVKKPDIVENTDKSLALDTPTCSRNPEDHFQNVCVTRTAEYMVVMKCQSSNILCDDSGRIKVLLDIANRNASTQALKSIESLRIEAIVDVDAIPNITHLAAYSANEKVNEYEPTDKYTEENAENTYGWNLSSYSDGSSKYVQSHDTCQYDHEDSSGNVSGENRSQGINYAEGCRTLLENTELNKHETENNSFKCFVYSCDQRETLNEIKEHMRKHHRNLLTECNYLHEILDKKDREWFIICFEKLFRCVYYYCYNEIEILVVYLGPSDEACDFKYKVKITSPRNQSMFLSKRAPCLKWNTTYLDRGIQYDLSTVMKEFGVKLSKFDIYVEIMQTKCS